METAAIGILLICALALLAILAILWAKRLGRWKLGPDDRLDQLQLAELLEQELLAIKVKHGRAEKLTLDEVLLTLEIAERAIQALKEVAAEPS